MLLSDIFTTDALQEHARKLIRKKFTAGYDRMSAQAASRWMEVNAGILQRELLSGQYRPMPALVFFAAKKSGGKQQLSRLTAHDTVVQSVLLEGIAPLCEKKFSSHSFAWRKGRGAAAALEMYCMMGAKHIYAAKLDIRRCFEGINHARLLAEIRSFFQDEVLSDLLEKIIKTPLCVDGEITQPQLGIVQGAPLSPLLCNIYLHSLDCLLEENEARFIRYGDDAVIFSNDREELERMVALCSKHLSEELGLELNAEKSSINSPSSLRFLGCIFERTSANALIAVSEEAYRQAYHTWNVSTPEQPRNTAEILSDGILRQKDFSLLFETGEEEINIPIATTQSINIYSNVIFDSGFLSRVMKKGMYVNLFDQHDHLIGRFIPERPLHAPKITLAQLEANEKEKRRLPLAQKFIMAAIHHQRLNIRYYNRHNPKVKFQKAIAQLDELEEQAKTCPHIEELLLIEAQAKQVYYDCFDLFLKQPEYAFEYRSRRPPHNEINALLSFGNMFLYSQLAGIINRSPLDIRIGCVHATNRRRESLNLDFANIYKPLVVDRTALALVNRRALRPYHFEKTEEGGVYLTAEGKRIYLEALYSKLADTHFVNEKEMTYRTIMAADVQALVRHYRDHDRYKPFRQVK